MKLLQKHPKRVALVLGIYQLLGGIVGLGMIAWHLTRVQTINGAILLIFLVAIGLYLFSVKCGSLLIRKEYKKGLIYSIIHQMIQVVHIAIGGDEFAYFSGGKLSFGPDFTNGFNLKLDFAIASQFDISINLSEMEYYLYINILAIVIGYTCWEIYKVMFPTKKEETVKPVSNLSEISEEIVQ